MQLTLDLETFCAEHFLVRHRSKRFHAVPFTPKIKYPLSGGLTLIFSVNTIAEKFNLRTQGVLKLNFYGSFLLLNILSLAISL